MHPCGRGPHDVHASLDVHLRVRAVGRQGGARARSSLAHTHIRDGDGARHAPAAWTAQIAPAGASDIQTLSQPAPAVTRP